MKVIICVTVLTGFLLLGAGCKKEMVETTPLASLKIANFVTGGSPVRLGSYFALVNNNQNVNFTLVTGNHDIYVWPVGDSLHPYYRSNKALAVAENDIYTLFLGGTPAAPEGLLVKESLPVHTDSTAGIRFVHLAPGGPTVNVTLSMTPGVNEFTGVDYLGITEFKKFPATSTNSSYTFQVRNASTGNIIASLSMPGTSLANMVPRFRNVTLVLRGIVGGSPGPGISRVNHY